MKQLLIFFLTILVFLISCNEKNLNVRYGVNLPDTINKRDTIGGVIFYKSDFDTIKLNMVRHYTYMVLDSISSFRGNKLFFTKVRKDTFGIIYDSIIPIEIYDSLFENSGKISLNGHIVDEIYLDINNVNSEEALKKSTLKTEINHTLYIKR